MEGDCFGTLVVEPAGVGDAPPLDVRVYDVLDLKIKNNWLLDDTSKSVLT